MDAVTAKGNTPASNSPIDISTAIKNINTGKKYIEGTATCGATQTSYNNFVTPNGNGGAHWSNIYYYYIDIELDFIPKFIIYRKTTTDAYSMCVTTRDDPLIYYSGKYYYSMYGGYFSSDYVNCGYARNRIASNKIRLYGGFSAVNLTYYAYE